MMTPQGIPSTTKKPMETRIPGNETGTFSTSPLQMDRFPLDTVIFFVVGFKVSPRSYAREVESRLRAAPVSERAWTSVPSLVVAICVIKQTD